MNLEIVVGDITQEQTDAIVNAANTSLLGGGGVDGAIHSAAGPDLLAECRTLGGCATGEAKSTAGYNLPARFVIHTVGPVWHGGDAGEDRLLASAYRSSLHEALRIGARSISFPCISTGVYHFPKERAATVALHVISCFLKEHPQMHIRMVCFHEEDAAILRAEAKRLNQIM